MAELWAATLLSFGVVFVAELGDKSQLMALTFAIRYRPLPVFAGIAVATAVVNGLSVAVGYGLGLAVPTGWAALAAGSLFMGFAVWTLRGEDDDPGPEFRNGRKHSVVVSVGSAFLLAELGDKTMLATVALATQNDWFGTWLGATLGMLLAVAIAITVGRVLGARLPARLLQLGAAALFAVFGIGLLIKAVAELT